MPAIVPPYASSKHKKPYEPDHSNMNVAIIPVTTADIEDLIPMQKSKPTKHIKNRALFAELSTNNAYKTQ